LPPPSESRDVCFVEHDDYKRFLQDRGIPLPQGGPILLANGTLVGRHQRLWRYTIGQRKGLGVPYGEPLYVLAKDPARNALVVGPRPDLDAAGCRAEQCNVLVAPSQWPQDVFIQTCYRMRPRSVSVAWSGDGLGIAFAKPLPRPAPCQLAVLYDAAGRVLAGGLIVESGAYPRGNSLGEVVRTQRHVPNSIPTLRMLIAKAIAQQ
jgi:tRNA-uridine 2-sulfurtransferase